MTFSLETSRTVTIMQPTFLPWMGYFKLLSEVDLFVFLDDVQVEFQSWQTRNKLLVNKQEFWLSLPLVKSSAPFPLLNDVKLRESATWVKKTQRTIFESYSKHPHFSDLELIIELVLNLNAPNLAAYNIEIIKCLMKMLQINTQTVLASELSVDGKRTSKIINICESVGANTYLSPLGAKDYLHEDGYLNETKIRLDFFSFSPVRYQQKNSREFIPYLSIFDVIANVGTARVADQCK